MTTENNEDDRNIALRETCKLLIEDGNKRRNELYDAVRDARATVAASKIVRIEAENKLLHEQCFQLQKEAERITSVLHHDPLTSALNRLGMDAALRQSMSAADRQKTPLSICMIDIDNFKKINDTFGHPVGDLVLVHLVKVLTESTRPPDFVARYGGEEFITILPNTAEPEAVEVMNRAQDKLIQHGFVNNSKNIPITFSGGVAQWVEDELAKDLISRADEMMYIAKRSGKKCVKSQSSVNNQGNE